MPKVSSLPLAEPVSGDETIVMVQDGVTKKGTILPLVEGAIAPFLEEAGQAVLASQLARDQAADLLLPQNTFIDVTVAAAEALVAEGTFFKVITTATGLAEVRRRTALGSDLLFMEATTAALNSELGASMLGKAGGGNVQQALDGLGSIASQNADDLDVKITRMRRPGFYNFRASSFLRWSTALASHRSGLARALVACLGDSTVRGVGSNGEPASADINIIRHSWPTVLAHTLNEMPLTKATANSLWCDGFFGMNDAQDLGDADPRVTWEAGWQSHPTMFVAGGRSFLYPETAAGVGRFNFNPSTGFPGPHEDDTVDVHFISFPGNARILVTTNDAATFVAGTDTAGPVGLYTLTGSRAAHFETAWTVQRSADSPDANLQFFGIESYKAADKPIGVWNMGASGSRVANWVDDNQPYSFINVIPYLRPQLSIICLTINDWAFDTPEAEYKADMQLIIDRCLLKGDVLLVVGVPSNEGTAPIVRQQAFAGYVRDMADFNDLPMIDLSERWVAQSIIADFGRYYDGLHPSRTGYADIGYLLGQVVGNPGAFYG